MAADTTAERQHKTAAVRWAGAIVLCLTVAVYSWHMNSVMERRVAALEAAVAVMHRQLADYPDIVELGQPLRSKRDAPSAGQCLCPPGKCIVIVVFSVIVVSVITPLLRRRRRGEVHDARRTCACPVCDGVSDGLDCCCWCSRLWFTIGGSPLPPSHHGHPQVAM